MATYPEPPTSAVKRPNRPRSGNLPRQNPEQKFTGEFIRHYLLELGITEKIFIYEQDYQQFMEEQGLKELGRGGEGAVYFLRGHAVKVVSGESVPAALREIAHMLHLNSMIRDGVLGERSRQDWPALLWVSILSNGSISIGMKPFDANNALPGSTLYDRLNFGPAFACRHALRVCHSIAQSLLYAERQGIIHHDLKPANIYIPGDPGQAPVVFDLGQALWRQCSWGRNALQHKHNSPYWYNGTYRYMHHERRLAHLGAMAASLHRAASLRQSEAMRLYRPSTYDDVFAYARILRDLVRSRYGGLLDVDKIALRKFYHRLMGLKHRSRSPVPMESGLIKRVTAIFQPQENIPRTEPPAAQRWNSMEHVLPEFEKVLALLETFVARPEIFVSLWREIG
jgi:serine/threonine protein kinase